jgi:signal transduction histidine kinase
LHLNVATLKRAIERAQGSPANPDALLKKLRALDAQTTRLKQLVDDLLDVSRVGAGKITLAPQEMDLAALVNDVCARLGEQAARAGSTLEVNTSTPALGRWDRNRLDQVVTNLLSNAVKYGAGFPIQVTVRKGDGGVELHVSDQGVGVAPEDHARIFERFERAATGRNFSGIGLGLWICREIVKAHGGLLTVESNVGMGATFRLVLPVEPKPPA